MNWQVHPAQLPTELDFRKLANQCGDADLELGGGGVSSSSSSSTGRNDREVGSCALMCASGRLHNLFVSQSTVVEAAN